MTTRRSGAQQRTRLFCLTIGGRRRASARLRVWDHLAWLHEAGFEVAAEPVFPDDARRWSLKVLLGRLLRYPRWVYAAWRADTLWLQETVALWPLLLLRRWWRRGRVVFDFSDPVDRERFFGIAGIRRVLFRLCVTGADLVICENPVYRPHLQAIGARRVAQVYGPVDMARYTAARLARDGDGSAQPLSVGWTGSPGTYRYIAALLPLLDRLAAEIPLRICLIGVDNVDYRCVHARLDLVAWSEDAEFATVPTFDLGLFALDHDEHGRFRGAGKLFIYTCAGVPFVASRWGIGEQFHTETGLGFMCGSPQDWEKTLRRALTDAAKRADDRVRGLRIGEEQLSYRVYRDHLRRWLVDD